MGLKTLLPARGEGRGVTRGVLLSLLLHPLALIAVGLIGSRIDRRDGYLLVLPFLAFLGIAQWIYIAPMAWWLRRRQAPTMAKGVVLGACAVTLLDVVVYGGIFMVSLANLAEVKRIEQYEREHPTDYFDRNGILTLVDDTHFEFKAEDDGSIVSLLTWPELQYVFLKKDFGYEIRTREMLKPGVRVNVEYSQERGKPPLSPMIVRVYEDGARR